jgi:hypothetical protein
MGFEIVQKFQQFYIFYKKFISNLLASLKNPKNNQKIKTTEKRCLIK